MKPRNPNGRKGGEAHQNLVAEVADEVENKGLFAKLEQVIDFLTGKRRFMDVAGLEKDSKKIVELHQIGKENKNGTPVKRERDVIQEVYEETGIEVNFHAYNKEEGAE
jgi:hypothetical protein